MNEITLNNEGWLSRIALFYKYSTWRLPVLVVIISISGVLDAAGIAILLPILNIAFEQAPNDPLSKIVIQIVTFVGIQPDLLNLLVLLTSLFLLRGVAMLAHRYFVGWLIFGVRKNTQIIIIGKISEITYPYYVNNTVGRFTNVLTTEANRFASGLRLFTHMSASIIHAIIYLPAALLLNPEFTFSVVVIAVIAFFLFNYFTRHTANTSVEVTSLNTIIQSHLIQYIQNLPYLKATDSLRPVKSQLVRRIGKLVKKECQVLFNISLINSFKEPIAVFTLAIFTYYQIVLASGNMAEVMVLALLIYKIMLQLLTVPADYQTFNSMIGGVDAIKQLTSELELNQEVINDKRIIDVKGDIEFHHVSYKLGEQYILRDISLRINTNTTIGIVGESGAGKTTFFYLLTGLIRPTSGHISVDGENYNDINLNQLRAKIGYVTQDPVVFNDTVANNIAFWRCDPNQDICQERIERAAKTAKCDEFIENMPQGINTILGERGIKLSGGQRQRVAIARELFKEPRILIFDEATSSLDAESERFVQQQIDYMRGERTIFIIAHRISTVRECDCIYVFSKGRVVQQGSFDELSGDVGSLFESMCGHQGVR